MSHLTNQPNFGPKTNTENRVAIVDLADELQVRKQWLFKIAKRLGVQASSRRELDRGNQMVATVAPTDAEAIRQVVMASRRSAQCTVSSMNGTTPIEVLGGEEGFLYLVQLEPEQDRGRFKVGFTTDLDGRLRKHRCSAPFALYVKSWPCRRTWERAVIDCMTTGLEQLHTEVFRTASLEETVSRGDRFFSLMPPVSGVPDADDEDATSEYKTQGDRIQ